MKNKILIYSIYPAPYREELFSLISKGCDVDVFFEHCGGDERNPEWFKKGSFSLLDTKDGKLEYKKAVKNIKNYSLVALYDYSSIGGIKLALKCKFRHVPYVLNCDGVMMLKHGNLLRDFIKKILIKSATSYLASGVYAKKYFLRYGAKEENIFIHTFSALHTGDTLSKPLLYEEKKALRVLYNLPIDKKIVIAVGRFIPLKRYDALIRIWKQMSDDVVLLLIGGGKERDNYERIIKELDLKNVILQDFHKFDELKKYYQLSDVFVHPTSYDVWGLVINEAMANGLPIVVSDHCVAGLELVKNDINGYIVPLYKDDELIDRLNRILNDKNLADNMAIESLKTIKNYTIENMAKNHLDIFNKLGK